MARSFTQSLLAAAVAVVVGGSVLAQDLKEAVAMYRLGKTEDCKAALRNILTADPSNSAALKLYQSVSQDEYFMLLTGSDTDIRQIAASILDRAKAERKERSRDDAAIRALVETATAKDSDHGTRQGAINKLITSHGEFAVPALVDKLGNKDDVDGQIQAIYALSQLNTVAVLPLIEALKSSNGLVVRNAAAALCEIDDVRALPAMAHLAGDSRSDVAAIATKMLGKHGVKASDVEMLLSQARTYLKGEVPAGGFSDVVWNLTEDKLVPTDVNALLYPVELAKACAKDAVAIAPQSLEASSVLAQANLAEANLIQTSAAQGDEAMKALEPVAASLKISGLAAGLPALRMALDAGLAQGLAPVSMGAIDALASAETMDSVGQSTLVNALASGDKRIKYAAAEALVRATGGVNVPAAEQVVAALAQAVTEEKVETIQVIDPSAEAVKAAEVASSQRGKISQATDSAVNGTRALLNNPNVDVLVINEILPDRMPEDVIGLVRKDSRMANTKIVVIAKDVEKAKERFKDSVQGVVQAPLSGEALVTEVNRVLEGVTTTGGARAEAFAKGASEALLAVAAKKGNIAGALDNLAKQLNRADAVSVPAAKSLGLAGTPAQFGALVAAMKDGSADLKKSAAEAIGQIMVRAEACPAEVVDALLAVVTSEGDVALRTAAAVALGKAKLEPAKAAEVQQKLHKVAATAPKS